MKGADLESMRKALETGGVIPYLGPGVLSLAASCPVPDSPESLVELLTAKVQVPHKVRKNLTAAAQFIENFRHRKTLASLMADAFRAKVNPTPLHNYLAGITMEPFLIVDLWYDNAMQWALDSNEDWGQIQGCSQSEHFGTWYKAYRQDGAEADDFEAETWGTVLYKPLGSISPEQNFLVSDTDFVEVMTEIDIQTPIPDVVKQLRAGRNFLFLGCRFQTQLERTFARQIMKRSSDKHWAVLPGELTRNEARFLEEQNIERIDVPLAEFVEALVAEKLAA